jgi:hypothetical protein
MARFGVNIENTVQQDAMERGKEEQSRAVPASVAARYLQVEDKFYSHDKKLAFIDSGAKLRAESNGIDVVRSLVEIAEARGWESVNVTGTKDFRRQVWREAAQRGIEVRGYEPTEIERAGLRRAEASRTPNEIAEAARTQAPGRTFDSEGVSQKAPPPATGREVYEGVLMAYGPEDYKFEPGKPSYQVRVSTGKQIVPLWGIGLGPALAESGATLGDRVVIERLGREAVNVNGAQAQRGVWTIQKVSPEKEAPAAEMKAPTKQPDPPAVQATMRAAELFADERIERPEDRQRFLDMLRKTLDAAKARGETIPEPKIKETPEIVRQHDEPVRA